MASTFHLDCLRDTPADPGPGTLIFTLRRPMAVRGPFSEEITVFVEGQTLYVERVDCMQSALARHLHGSVESSAFRRGIAAVLGYDRPERVSDVEQLIDLYSTTLCFARLGYDDGAQEKPIEGGLLNRLIPDEPSTTAASQEG